MLCSWLSRSCASTVAGATVLELGAGTGAVGIYCAALGARRVVLTDGDPSTLALAADNARRNRSVGLASAAAVELLPLRWGCRADVAAVPPCDLILGSDVIYEASCHADLCETLLSLMQRSPLARVVLATMPRQRVSVAPARYSEAALVSFARVGLDHGLRLVALDEAEAGEHPLVPASLVWSARGFGEQPPFAFEVVRARRSE